MMPIVDACVYLKQNTYELSDYLNATSQFHVLRMVAKQDFKFSPNLSGLQYLQSQAQTRGSGGLPNAIIATVDLVKSEDIQALVGNEGFPNLRGVSVGLDASHSYEDYLPSLALLKESSLSLVLNVNSTNVALAAELANAQPELQIVVIFDQVGNRAAGMASRQDESQLRELSVCENINITFCAPSDLQIERIEQQANGLRGIFDLFGFDRIMFGSGFNNKLDNPLYDRLWSNYIDACEKLTAKQRDKLLRSNAIRIYSL